jgi:hypothetical protein
MSYDRFDFEQQIVKCWTVVEELKDLDEGLFEGWLNFDKDNVSNHILGIANCFDVKFHKLWELFETVHMDLVRENKMLNEECAALREQLQQSDPDTHGYGIAAIKPKKKDKK